MLRLWSRAVDLTRVPTDQYRRRIDLPYPVIVIALMLFLSACTTDQLVRICQNAGGRYTNEGCDASTPAQKAAKEWCETHGGVYLAGQEYCAFGAGGA